MYSRAKHARTPLIVAVTKGKRQQDPEPSPADAAEAGGALEHEAGLPDRPLLYSTRGYQHRTMPQIAVFKLLLQILQHSCEEQSGLRLPEASVL